MEFIRWYSWPVLVGFIFSLLLNPLVAGIGFIVWLAVVGYAAGRRPENP